MPAWMGVFYFVAVRCSISFNHLILLSDPVSKNREAYVEHIALTGKEHQQAHGALFYFLTTIGSMVQYKLVISLFFCNASDTHPREDIRTARLCRRLMRLYLLLPLTQARDNNNYLLHICTREKLFFTRPQPLYCGMKRTAGFTDRNIVLWSSTNRSSSKSISVQRLRKNSAVKGKNDQEANSLCCGRAERSGKDDVLYQTVR